MSDEQFNALVAAAKASAELLRSYRTKQKEEKAVTSAYAKREQIKRNLQILAAVAAGTSIKQLAEQYHITPAHIRGILLKQRRIFWHPNHKQFHVNLNPDHKTIGINRQAKSLPNYIRLNSVQIIEYVNWRLNDLITSNIKRS